MRDRHAANAWFAFATALEIFTASQARVITLSALAVEIVPKPINNLHVGLTRRKGACVWQRPWPWTRRPSLVVVGKLGLIKRQRAKFQVQPRQSERRMVSGESHYCLGRRYRLRVHASTGALRIALRGKATLAVHTSRTSRAGAAGRLPCRAAGEMAAEVEG
jgi:hypothetical protein